MTDITCNKNTVMFIKELKLRKTKKLFVWKDNEEKTITAAAEIITIKLDVYGCTLSPAVNIRFRKKTKITVK